MDSGVVMRALGELQADSDAQLCVDLFQAMLGNGCDILIAAPTLAEVIRKDGTKSIPRHAGIEVVSFDDVAAEILGRSFPMSVLKTVNHASTTLTHLKYDALIFACAIRHGAECIVAIDDDYAKLSAALGVTGLPVYHPRVYLAPQATLAFPAVSPVSSKP
jgi:predicted nucleic acid-binding protein